MATRPRIGPKKPRRLFHKEWRDYRDMTLEEVGARLGDEGVSKSTVQRWEKEPWRLDPGIIAALAEVFDITVEEMWRHPPLKPEQPDEPPPSLDKMLKGVPKDLRETVHDLVAKMVKRA